MQECSFSFGVSRSTTFRGVPCGRLVCAFVSGGLFCLSARRLRRPLGVRGAPPRSWRLGCRCARRFLGFCALVPSSPPVGGQLPRYAGAHPCGECRTHSAIAAAFGAPWLVGLWGFDSLRFWSSAGWSPVAHGIEPWPTGRVRVWWVSDGGVIRR